MMTEWIFIIGIPLQVILAASFLWASIRESRDAMVTLAVLWLIVFFGGLVLILVDDVEHDVPGPRQVCVEQLGGEFASSEGVDLCIVKVA